MLNLHRNSEMPMDYRTIISIHPEMRSGKPCIRDTRMTVGDVLQYLSTGMTINALVEEFPNITEVDVLACLAFASDREKRIVVVTPAA